MNKLDRVQNELEKALKPLNLKVMKFSDLDMSEGEYGNCECCGWEGTLNEVSSLCEACQEVEIALILNELKDEYNSSRGV
jgi:hypothetical protein